MTLSRTIRDAWFSGDVVAGVEGGAVLSIFGGVREPLEIRLTTATAPLVWQRNAGHIARDHSHTAIIWLILEGRMKITGPNGTHIVRGGELCIMTSEVPFIVEGQQTPEQPLVTLTVSVGHAILQRHFETGPHLGLPYASTAPEGGMAASLFRNLLDQGEGFEATLAAKIADDALACIAHTILKQSQPHAGDQATSGPLDAVRSFISAHLYDPDLSGELIALRCGISRRHLHHLLKRADTSLADLIWKQRLYNVANALADPAVQATPISAIAFHAGYKNYEHFCRAFRRAFGVAPREFRQRRLVSSA